MLKRLIDLTLASLGLIVFAPVMAAVASVIGIRDGRPVLFAQERIGRDFVPFTLLKFRTMGDVTAGPLITVSDDARITRTGRYLRASKLDELPQLLNVVRGDMALVGPRPEVERYVDLYREEFTEILSVRPGITGEASIRFRHESEILSAQCDPEGFYVHTLLPEKIAVERRYVRNWSWKRDVGILVETVRILFR